MVHTRQIKKVFEYGIKAQARERLSFPGLSYLIRNYANQ